MRTGVAGLLAVCLAACGGDAGPTRAPGADEARQTAAAPPPPATPAPAPPSAGGRAAAVSEPAPTAADSAAAAREDVSPEWKMNERSMAPYAECMAQARSMPDAVRGRLEDACRQRSGAPR